MNLTCLLIVGIAGNYMSKALDAKTCVRAFLGDGDPTPEALGRLMEYFYIHDFTPLKHKVDHVSTELVSINDTLHQWQAQLRILIVICSVVGGLVSAAGTILGIYFTLHP